MTDYILLLDALLCHIWRGRSIRPQRPGDDLLTVIVFSMTVRAGRYDDIYRMEKVYRFILCSIVYFVVSQNTLFTVLFHHLDDCDLYTPPRGVKGRQK